MEIFVSFASGFAIGWASAWVIQCMPYLKNTPEKKVDYNMIEKSLSDFVDSEYDPENYLGKAEGTK